MKGTAKREAEEKLVQMSYQCGLFFKTDVNRIISRRKTLLTEVITSKAVLRREHTW